MATLYGANYEAAYVTLPKSMIDAKEASGKLRILSDSITLSAEVALNDVIVAGKLPPGAKVIDARFVAPSDGTTGQYDFGWASNGTDAADSDGFFAGATLDSGAGAVDAKMGGTAAGFLKEFADVETTIQFLCIEATTASSGDTLKWVVVYSVE